MPRITRDIITHELKINVSIQPITQKQRPMSEEKAMGIRKDVEKLINAHFVKEIRFQT